MLKRANIALMGALVPGFLAYTGWAGVLTPVARAIALVLLGFSAVSFLLSLFEDEPPPLPVEAATIDDVQPMLPLVFSEPQPARVAP